MNAIEILTAMSNDDMLAEEVLGYLNHGMFDEWDCDLWKGCGELGFGGPELRIAARSGLALAKYHESHPESKRH